MFTKVARNLYRRLTVGSYLDKYTNSGKVRVELPFHDLIQLLRDGMRLIINTMQGASHSRYFWVDAVTGKLCWAASPADAEKHPDSGAPIIPRNSAKYSSTLISHTAVSSELVLDVARDASRNIKLRKDYDAEGVHKYSFTVFTVSRTLDLVAATEEYYRFVMLYACCYRSNPCYDRASS